MLFGYINFTLLTRSYEFQIEGDDRARWRRKSKVTGKGADGRGKG